MFIVCTWTAMLSVFGKRLPASSAEQWQKTIPLLVLSHTQEGLPFSLILSLLGTDFIWFHRVKSWNLETNTLRILFLALYYMNIFNSNIRVCCLRLWEKRCFRKIYYFLLILRIWGTSVIYLWKTSFIFWYYNVIIFPFLFFFQTLPYIPSCSLLNSRSLFSYTVTYICVHAYVFFS